MQIIGIYNTEKGTWHWAWDNPSVAAPLAGDARRVRAYGKKNRIAKLTVPSWSAQESDAWDMTALAASLGDAEGAYLGPSGNHHIFMTFGEVSLSKPR